MQAVKAPMTKRVTAPANVLVVDDEPDMIEMVGDIVGRQINCRIFAARDLREAREIMASTSVDLMLTDISLPDGDGLSLLPDLHRQQPSATAMVITGRPSVDCAVEALREGAVDFVTKPFNADQLIARVSKALVRGDLIARNERRLSRLRSAIKRLSKARKVINRKVDLLCNDLISAYGELTKQVEGVRGREGFRKFLGEAKDLEQMLCHTMDWILRQLGYCNVALWLMTQDETPQLGAYMKYTIPGEGPIVEAMSGGLVRQTMRQGAIRLTADEAREVLTPAELEHLEGQTVLSINCTYLAEPLAAIICFRDDRQPFTDEDAAMLQMISPIFALALADIVRPTSEEREEEDTDTLPPDDQQKPGRKKKDDADWWKRGEDSPY